MPTAPGTIDVKFEFDVEPFRRMVDTLVSTAEIYEIYGDVSAEIRRAREKHGAQHHLPMGTGPEVSLLEQLDHAAASEKLYTDNDYTLDCLDNAQFEQAAKRLCADGGTGDGTGGATWATIVFEEFAEAMAADNDDLDAELVQLIAMGVSMLQAHRRQQDPKS